MSNAQKVSDLLPCPFCQKSMEPRDDYGRERMEHRLDADGEGLDCPGFTLWFYTDDPLQVAAWNRRAAPTPDAHSEVGDLLERLELGVISVGLHDDNNTELFDVDDASDAMLEAAVALRLAHSLAGAVKAEPVAVTDEMVERGCAGHYVWWNSSDEDAKSVGRTIVKAILTAALASKPEGER